MEVPETVKKLLTVFKLAASLCWALSVVQAQDLNGEKQLTSQQILNEMVANSKYRPEQVATVEAFEMPLVIDGKASGSVKVQAGCALNVVSVKSDGVVVEIHGNQKKLAIDKTDVIARYADRKKAVDKKLSEDRAALIAAGEEILVLPPPPVVAEISRPTTEIVYIDNSDRVRINRGDYWPYTNYSPYYNAGYVIQPRSFYPPFYYQPGPLLPICPPVNKPHCPPTTDRISFNAATATPKGMPPSVPAVPTTLRR